MKELNRAIQKKLFISAYWPRRQADEPNIGYGIRKDYMIYQGAGAIISLATRGFTMFFEPRVRPTLRPLVRFAPILVISLILGILLNRSHKYTGFYQLDDQGTPIHFLAPSLPESIQGRFGISRKKFLEQMAQSK